MKHLLSVISAYVTLKKFTPGLQKFYTDISAISATFSNSGYKLVADIAILVITRFSMPHQHQITAI